MAGNNPNLPMQPHGGGFNREEVIKGAILDAFGYGNTEPGAGGTSDRRSSQSDRSSQGERLSAEPIGSQEAVGPAMPGQTGPEGELVSDYATMARAVLARRQQDKHERDMAAEKYNAIHSAAFRHGRRAAELGAYSLLVVCTLFPVGSTVEHSVGLADDTYALNTSLRHDAQAVATAPKGTLEGMHKVYNIGAEVIGAGASGVEHLVDAVKFIGKVF